MSEIRFEMDRLVSYSDEAILDEIRRVGAVVDGPMTRAGFDRHARVTSSTVVRRFGDWRAALNAAGLGVRYSGRTVSPKMRAQTARVLSDDELVEELRAVAAALGTRTLTREAFRKQAATVNDSVYVRRFGSWSEALKRAGLGLSHMGRRWTDEHYFENLLAVWTHHGRAPTHAEMNLPPSRITNGAYENKFGTWGRAKQAFVERVNADLSGPPEERPSPVAESKPTPARPRSKSERGMSLGLRYKVLSRDRFRCSICGRSPATDLDCKLHVDHVVPVAAGGKTVEENFASPLRRLQHRQGIEDRARPSGSPRLARSGAGCGAQRRHVVGCVVARIERVGQRGLGGGNRWPYVFMVV